MPIQLCSPAGVSPGHPLPLLVAHDGGELEALAQLTHYAAATVAAGAVPAYRIALLSPLDRDNWYSGSEAYGRTLAGSVLPLLRHEVAVAGPVVGYGASLGALSMLATQLRHPGTFGGLMLASGSFFHPTDDPQESGFRGTGGSSSGSPTCCRARCGPRRPAVPRRGCGWAWSAARSRRTWPTTCGWRRR